MTTLFKINWARPEYAEVRQIWILRCYERKNSDSRLCECSIESFVPHRICRPAHWQRVDTHIPSCSFFHQPHSGRLTRSGFPLRKQSRRYGVPVKSKHDSGRSLPDTRDIRRQQPQIHAAQLLLTTCRRRQVSAQSFTKGSFPALDR